MTRSPIVCRRLVVIMNVADVASDMIATATTVSKRWLSTGVIARLLRKNRLRCFTFFRLT
jgi:hypothetical protein